MRILLVLALVLSASLVRAQDLIRPELHPAGILFVVTDKSGLVTNESPLYLASNWGGWAAGEQSMRLSGRSDLRWQILLPGPADADEAADRPPLAFKFTRGSWETVEVDEELADINNRTLPRVDPATLDPNRPVMFELVIDAFADQREGAATPQFRDDPTRPLNVTGEAFRVQVVGGAGAATGALRDVVVWLPPGYDDPANADRRYPVLYMQDGQNVFDFRPPTPAEWQADETAARLIQAGEIEPVIIVAIPHSGANRTAEYLPRGLTDALEVEADGDRYLDWLVREVVPRVERIIRASSDPAERGFGGASLGGLLALRAAQRHPDVFGRFLCESPALVLREETVTEAAIEGIEGSADMRMFIAMGGLEYGADQQQRNAALIDAVRDVGARLAESGHEGAIKLVIDPDAEHNEHAWADRLDDALRHLYPAD